MSEIVKKITVKTVCGKFEKPSKASKLMTVYGLANEAKADSSDYGDYVRFKGNFEAVNLATGEVFKSGSMILPEIAEQILSGALSGEDVNGVQFALEIGIKPSTSPVGYDYSVKPVIDTGENDPLADLRGKLSLPAPKGDAVNQH